jgi:hypothetical protein
MGALRYALHGLTFESDIPLNTSLDVPDNGCIALSREICGEAVGDDRPGGDVIAELTIGERRFYTGTDDGDHYTLRIHGVCDFVVDRALTSVRCVAPDSTEVELLSLLVRGALIAFILGLGGSCVLHASVVEADAGSVVFVGISGMGKSTMAALACRDGARFVSDDLLRLSDEAHPSWVGCSSELRLRPAASALAESEWVAWSARETVDDRVALKPPASSHPSGRIGAVVMPAPTRVQPELEMTRLDPFDAIIALSAFPRMLWTLPAAQTAQFEGVSRLAEAVPTYRVSVPWGPPFAPGLGARIVDGVLAT